MELSPKLYHCVVRPRWFSKIFIENIIKERFDFDNKKILDFGSGIGSSCIMFHPENYLGLEKDPDRVSYAKRLFSEYTFKTLEDELIPAPSASIDFILIIAVLHHLSDKEVSNYLSEFYRVLSPNGQIIVIEPCYSPTSTFNNRFMKFFDNGKYIRDEKGYLALFQNLYCAETIKQFKKVFYNEIFFSATPID